MKRLITLFVLLFFINTVSAASEVKAGVTPDSFWWRFELAFEKVQEKIRPETIQIHQQERMAELEKMLDNGEIAAVERLQAQIQNREQFRERVRNRLQITKSDLEQLKDTLNDKISKSGSIKDDIPDGTFIIKVTMVDDTVEYYKVTLADKQITDILKLDAAVNDYDVSITHGQFDKITKGSVTEAVNVVRNMYQNQETNRGENYG